MDKMINNNKQLAEAVKAVPMTAEKESWVLTLDKEENTLFFSPKRIPDGAELHQVTDEYALYLSKDMKPQGLMIEYYGQNFVQHHKEFQDLDKKLFSKKEGTVVIDPKARNASNDAKYFKAMLIDNLLSETVTGALT